MSFSRYFYEQHGEALKKENKLYDAVQESHKISTKRCKHKKTTLEGNTLRCSCGAFWQGPGVAKLQKML